MVFNLILGIFKLLCHGLVPDGVVKLDSQEKVEIGPKSTVKNTLFEK